MADQKAIINEHRSCPPGWQLCGLWDNSATSKRWECVNTMGDLESCGGCATEFADPFFKGETGKDCTAIPNVDTVSCLQGRCYIKKCNPGFEPTADRSECRPISSTSSLEDD
jgi:hypothetical protein